MSPPRLKLRRAGHVSRPRRSSGRSALSSSPFSPLEWQFIGRTLQLCPRELDLVRCLCRGLSNARIARRLGISPRTVTSYLDRLYRRLGVHSRTAAVLRLFAAYASFSDDQPGGLALSRRGYPPDEPA